MVEIFSHVELDQMFEDFIVVYASVECYDLFGVGISVLVYVCLTKGSIRAAEITADLLHHLLVEDVLGPSEGHRHPPAAHLSVLENEIRFYLLLDYIALGRVIVMLTTLQSMDLD